MSTESIVAAAVSSTESVGLADFEDTLTRLVDRIVKILQAESCVFMLHDTKLGELWPVEPALGLTPSQLASLRCKTSDTGVSGQVFRSGKPDVIQDSRIDKRPLSNDHETADIKSAVCVPLIKEVRDEQNNIISTVTIGVLYVFNKSRSGIVDGVAFDEEDVNLLLRMASSAAGIIASAQVFQEVVQEKQELIHTIESLYIGLVVIGANNQILQINPSAKEILHISDTENPVGRPYFSIIAHAGLQTLLARSLSGSSPTEVNGEISVPVPAEQYVEGDVIDRIYQVQCAPVRGSGTDDTVGIVVLLNDITEIRGVDRMKTAFISTVSHELRTPLTSIKGFIATLLADHEGFYDHQMQREFYQIIDSECDRLTRLVDDLLSASRIEQGKALEYKFQTVDLPELVHQVIATQSASASNHQLVAEFPSYFPKIQADRDRLLQVLTNLLGNAIKYSPKGGLIRINGTVQPDGKFVQIRVSDRGIGIPREHLAKIFERFHRVDNRDNREIGGTGIGLYLVKSMVEAHHGTVDVQSELGKGSVFTVNLPLHQPKA